MRLHEFFISLAYERSLGFRIWQGVILGIRSVSLASFLTLFNRLQAKSFIPTTKLGSAITLAAFIEASFFIYYKKVRKRLQNLKPLPHRCKTTNERRALVEQCVETFRPPPLDCEEVPNPYVRIAIEKWFLDSPLEHITRNDFTKWCSWAFFNSEIDNLNNNEKLELEEHINWFENKIQFKFKLKAPRSAKPVKSIRLSLDPVIDTHRPLVYYIVISIMNTIGKTTVWGLGFRFRNASPLKGVLYRPAKKTKKKLLNNTNNNNNNELNNSENTEGRPIVFIHGIGIGFAHYLMFLFKLPTDVPIILLEWQHVSMQVIEHVPTIQETIEGISNILTADGHKDAVFVGHSLGTTAISWMLHDKKARHLVKGAVMLDPVTFLLINPGIAFNFIHREPTTVLELLMHYFVSRELFIAHTLSRHFSWSHNVIFPEILPGCCDGDNKKVTISSDCKDYTSSSSLSNNTSNYIPLTSIYFSENDAIVPAPDTYDYLKRNKQNNIDYKLTMLPGYQHGELMLIPKDLNLIVNDIHERCFMK
mmetsp:Transcript_919/g.1182  ORF Transcript_919/g.1182 Transcript_919/m.1182 type:complete len:533 (+) Transcript_919:108-1706(+)